MGNGGAASAYGNSARRPRRTHRRSARVEWARLLHVQVIAEIAREQARDFWSSSPEVQAQVVESFRKVAAAAIVAEQIPPAEVFAPPSSGWQRIGNTEFYVNLPPRAASTAGTQPDRASTATSL